MKRLGHERKSPAHTYYIYGCGCPICNKQNEYEVIKFDNPLAYTKGNYSYSLVAAGEWSVVEKDKTITVISPIDYCPHAAGICSEASGEMLALFTLMGNRPESYQMHFAYNVHHNQEWKDK